MDFSKLGGLIPAVVQDEVTAEVLMVGFMNEEAFERTMATGYATFFSRTRRTLWMKGETSGNRLKVIDVRVDCDRRHAVAQGRGARVTATCVTPGRGPASRTRARRNSLPQTPKTVAETLLGSLEFGVWSDRNQMKISSSAYPRARSRTRRSSCSRAPGSTSMRATGRTSLPSTILRSNAC